MKSKILLSTSSPTLVGKFSKVVTHVLLVCLLLSSNLTFPVFRNSYGNVVFAHDEDDRNHDDGDRKHKDKIFLKTVSDAPDPFSAGASPTAEFQSQYQIRETDGFKFERGRTNKKFFVRQGIRLRDARSGVGQVRLESETEIQPPAGHWDEHDDHDKFILVSVRQPWDGRDALGAIVPDGLYQYEAQGEFIRVKFKTNDHNRHDERDEPDAEDHRQEDATKVKFIAQSNVLTGEITVDNTPPVIFNLIPVNGTTLVDNLQPETSAQFSDNLTGVDVASVEITLDGSSVTAFSAIAASGFTFVPSGVLSAGVHTVSVIVKDFAGNPAEATSTFTLEETSVIPPLTGPDAGYVHGTVYDSFTDAPLQGAVVTVNGVEGAVLTGAQGKFIFPVTSYPQENKKTVVVTIGKEGYTYAQRRVTVTSTRDVAVDPAYLTPLDGRVTVITSTGGIATNATGTIEMIFQPGAVTQNIEAGATEFIRGIELPAPLPETSFFTHALDLRPDGATFNQPVTVRLANSRHFAPGTPIPVGYYQKDMARWVHHAMGQITADGAWIEFETTHFSPFDLNYPVVNIQDGVPPAVEDNQPPRKLTKENIDQTKDTKDPGVSIRSGNLTLENTLASRKIFGKSQAVTFTYTSDSAYPRAFIGTETNLDVPTADLPNSTAWGLQIEGVRQDVKFIPGAGKSRQFFSFTARNARSEILRSGSYPYQIVLSNNYQGEYYTSTSFGGPPIEPTGVVVDNAPLSTTVNGRLVINNQQTSPLGAGWTFHGLERLHFDPDGKILLTKGDGSSSVFTPNVIPGHFVSGIFAPGILTVDEQDNLYIPTLGDIIGGTVYKVTPEGVSNVYSTLTGSAVVFDSVGNLYLSNELGTIYKVDPSGTMTAFADGFEFPAGLAFDREGILYVADDSGNVYKVTAQGKQVFAGGFGDPSGLAFDKLGNLYVADTAQGKVFKITPDGVKSVFASGLSLCWGLDFDVADNLYVTAGDSILQINPEGKVIPFVNGFGFLTGLVFDSLGNLYAADSANQIIHKIPTAEFLSGSYISPEGDFSRLTHNVADDTYTHVLKDGTRMNFNSQGLHTSTVDRNGNAMTYAYADVNNDGKAEELTTIIDPAGGVTGFTYTNGYLSQITDPAGRISQFSIDGAGNFVSVTTPDGATVEYAYDQNHLINEVTNPLGHRTQYVHSPEGRYHQIVFPAAETINFMPSETQGLINDIPEGVGTPGNPAPFVPGGIPDLLTNTRGFITAYTTDKFGAVMKETDPLGRVTEFLRNADSNPTKIIRPNGSVVDMTYDGKGNLLSLTEASINAVTIFTYDPVFNQVTSIKDPLGRTTTIAYDAKGNPVKVTDALGNQTNMTYDIRGLLSSVKDAQNNMTTFVYDASGNLISTTDPLGRITALIYDASGNVTTSTDAEGKITNFAYDAMNRLTRVTDANGGVTVYSYDAAGNLTQVTDASGNSTAFAYDTRNRLIQTTDPLGKVETYTYDAGGNLIQTTDRRLRTIDFVYDAVNQLIQKTLPGNLITAFTYDNVGNLTSVTDPDSALSFTYDGANRLTIVVTTGSPNQPEVTLNYTYDKNGNRLTMADSVTGVTSYTYDALNRLSILDPPSSSPVNFSYDALSRRTSLTLPNGVTTNYSYDTASQLSVLSHELSAVPFTSFNYTYDNVGNRVSSLQNRTSVAVDSPLNYVYDNLYRLTQATHPLPAQPDETFAYDALGNRLLRDGQSTSATFDAANRLLEDEQFSYTYDDSGNLIQKTETAVGMVTGYTYDAENQLIQIAVNGSTAGSYRYDGLGRRIQKDVGGAITRYVYDNEDILLEYDGADILQARYAHGPGIDEPLGMERGGQSCFYHTDGLGSITDLTDNSGNVIQSYVYDSFGNIVEQAGSLINPYAYTGREFDIETGLNYYRRRYYDSAIGRFLSRDPLDSALGSSLLLTNGAQRPIPYFKPVNEVNPYLYTSNNPINRIDPLGLWYIDLNVSLIFPWWGGGTAGAMINQKGIWKYSGGSVGLPGPGASVTYSQQDPSIGWNFSVQGNLLYGVQYGYDLNNVPFAEQGLATPGGGYSAFYVDDPWYWPWYKAKEDKQDK